MPSKKAKYVKPRSREQYNRDTAPPPTPGFHKLGSGAQAAALSRAKAFYPFD